MAVGRSDMAFFVLTPRAAYVRLVHVVDRRHFLKTSLAVSAGAAFASSLEDRALLAYAAEDKPSSAATQPSSGGDMPRGSIGQVRMSRLIFGGNLISGFAHSRDLMYVSALLTHYFTDEKVFETFKIGEQHGVNTAILRLDPDTLRILSKYWREQGGDLQWIAQIKPREGDPKEAAKQAVDNGAVGVYIQGESGDAYVRNGHVDVLGEIIEYIKANNVIAGIGAHAIETVIACEKAGIRPDFYMKTLNSNNYWSAGPMPRHDSVWEETPQETIEFMKKVEKPWIAFKVLGAGAIHPNDGFKYAFENGADFICVGMFDFQVAEDAAIAKKVLAQTTRRERAWKP
jgi:hypothetical protein